MSDMIAEAVGHYGYLFEIQTQRDEDRIESAYILGPSNIGQVEVLFASGRQTVRTESIVGWRVIRPAWSPNQIDDALVKGIENKTDRFSLENIKDFDGKSFLFSPAFVAIAEKIINVGTNGSSTRRAILVSMRSHLIKWAYWRFDLWEFAKKIRYDIDLSWLSYKHTLDYLFDVYTPLELAAALEKYGENLHSIGYLRKYGAGGGRDANITAWVRNEISFERLILGDDKNVARLLKQGDWDFGQS